MAKRLTAREAIIETCAELLQSRTIEQISVKDILEECGVSKPTFYKYFGNKYDVLHECIRAKSDLLEGGKRGSVDMYHFWMSQLTDGDEAAYPTDIAYEILRDYTFCNQLTSNTYERCCLIIEEKIGAEAITEEMRFKLKFWAESMTRIGALHRLGYLEYPLEDVVRWAVECLPDVVRPYLLTGGREG